MPSPRRALLLAAATVAAGLILWVPGASAVITVAKDNDSLVLVTDEATGYNDPSIDFAGDRLSIGNSYHLALDPSASADCELQQFENEVLCDNVFADLQAQFAGSADTFTLSVCFPTATIGLGDGSDIYDGPYCGATSTVTVFGELGADTLHGSKVAGNATVEQLVGGDGLDGLDGGQGDDLLYGGDGDDPMTDDGGNDQLFGEGGDDTIRGGVGNDVEDGGPGDDKIGYGYFGNDEGAGADALSGGEGNDTLLLDGHPDAMTISIDGQANDGMPGEGDNIASDFERIEGTKYNDVFVGSPQHDFFTGGEGDDNIHGGDGDDDIAGDHGEDTLNGDGGNDKVAGDFGSDTVDGGAGSDEIYGDIAHCSSFCTTDDPDTLFARDGEKDTVNCGGGPDSAQVDSLDLVTQCASVDRSSDTTRGDTNDNTDTDNTGRGNNAVGFDVKIAGSIKLKALLKNGLAVKLTCAGACKAGAKLSYKAKKLGSANKALLKAGSVKFSVKLVKKGKSAVRKLKHGKLTVRMSVSDGAGKTTPFTRTVKLKR